MGVYDDMQGVATELLTEFDQTAGTVKYVAVTPGAGPVDNPGAPGRAEHVLKGAVRGARYKYVMRGLALATDMQITIPATLGFVPDMKGFILIGSEQHKIVQCMPKPPVGTTVAYTLIFRK